MRGAFDRSVIAPLCPNRIPTEVSAVVFSREPGRSKLNQMCELRLMLMGVEEKGSAGDVGAGSMSVGGRACCERRVSDGDGDVERTAALPSTHHTILSVCLRNAQFSLSTQCASSFRRCCLRNFLLRPFRPSLFQSPNHELTSLAIPAWIPPRSCPNHQNSNTHTAAVTAIPLVPPPAQPVQSTGGPSPAGCGYWRRAPATGTNAFSCTRAPFAQPLVCARRHCPKLQPSPKSKSSSPTAC